MTEAEVKCLNALKRLKKTHGNKKPPMKDVVRETGYSRVRAGQLMQLLEARGIIGEVFEIRV